MQSAQKSVFLPGCNTQLKVAMSNLQLSVQGAKSGCFAMLRSRASVSRDTAPICPNQHDGNNEAPEGPRNSRDLRHCRSKWKENAGYMIPHTYRLVIPKSQQKVQTWYYWLCELHLLIRGSKDKSQDLERKMAFAGQCLSNLAVPIDDAYVCPGASLNNLTPLFGQSFSWPWRIGRGPTWCDSVLQWTKTSGSSAHSSRGPVALLNSKSRDFCSNFFASGSLLSSKWAC